MARLNGIDVSLVGLGCNNFGSRCDEEQSAAVVNAALEAGVTFFDTADSYGGTRSEEFLGRALGGRRSEVIVATKFGSRLPDGQGGAHPDYVPRAAEASLRRLGTDWIDLYQLHFPDQDVPVADTMGALDDLVRAGKVRAIGCSNVTSAWLNESFQIAGDKGMTPFSTVQNEFSLLQRRPEKNLLPACVALGAGFLPYFPLASGLLSGKYRQGEPPPPGTRLAGMPADRKASALSDDRLAAVEQLRALAERRGHSLLELAMSWLASRPATLSIIAGATKPEQVKANAAAVGWQLSPEDLAAIDAIVPPPS
jgi:aryl-alcohol dehydrogenase-like predicted oxidoreductase